ncbi:MAG: hypothetical protein C0436_00150 [Alphaproteobacteria bacterium]|nr:hypothetical protein [Alphaproteobacteria bacterium]
MAKPELFNICIPAGTMVAELRNGKTVGIIEERHFRVKDSVYVQATRHDDGCWGYTVAGKVYACAGGLAKII